MITRSTISRLALGAAILAGAASLTKAQDSGPLIDTLVKKGILTDQEAEDLRADLLRDFGGSSAGKINLSSALTEFKISGDARVRYEYRAGDAGVAAGAVNAGDQQERGRFRYRLRLALSGKFADGWFFGTRIEPLGNNRSTNVTAGNGLAASGPYNKEDSLAIGQAYLGKNWNDFTFTAGRMPNPLVTTSMVWDDDINPEGLAEQWSHGFGDTTVFANLGQFVYEGSGTTNPLGGAKDRPNTYMWAFQGGAKTKLSDNVTLQVAPAYYTYSGDAGGMTAIGGVNNVNTLRPVGLQVVEIPIELGFKVAGLPAKIFGDYAINLDAETRANAAGLSSYDGEDTAYQIGAALGQTKNKGDWELKAFYQATEAFSLDSNLVDSDLFDSRVNMEGYVVSFSYVITNGVTFKATYADADRKNDDLRTFGAGDIGTSAVENYKLFQADLSVKF